MPRLPAVPRDEVTHPVIKVMYDRKFGDDGEPKPTVTGAPGNWEAVFARAPEVLEHVVRGFVVWRSPDRKLDPLLRELAMARTGWAMGSKFVFSQHCKVLRGYGGSEEQVAAIPDWQLADCFDAAGRAVLAYTDCLCYEAGRVPDELFEELRRHLDDEQIVELTYITCMYATNAAMTKAVRLEFDDREDPVVEVPPPPHFDLAAVREPLVLPNPE